MRVNRYLAELGKVAAVVDGRDGEKWCTAQSPMGAKCLLCRGHAGKHRGSLDGRGVAWESITFTSLEALPSDDQGESGAGGVTGVKR